MSISKWRKPAIAILIAFLWAGCGGSNSTPSPVVNSTPPPTTTTTPSTPSSFAIVADTLGNRVLFYGLPVSAGESATSVIGQADLSTKSPGATSSTMNNPVAAIEDANGNLWVSDWGNNRILEFAAPLKSGMNASLVLGQADFTSTAQSETTHGLALPQGLAFDKAGNLWVADMYNSRVLMFTPPFTSGMDASLVLGKTPNRGTGTCAGPETGLCGPTSLAFDGAGNLWVTDTDNNRVLEFTPPFTATQSASLVLGQADLTTKNYAVGPNSLNYPWGITLDASGNLWISDALNWRVLEFKPPFSSGQAASLVLGMSDLNATANPDRKSGMGNPRGLSFDKNGNLFVVDLNGFRVMEFAPPFSNGMAAAMALGQPDLTTVTSTGGFGLSAVGVSMSK